MVSQRIVRFDAVWHHLDSLISDGDGGATASTASEVLETARLATAFRAGEAFEAAERIALVGLVGAGDAVEVREGFLVGEGSNAGKSPWGCWRVDTIMSIDLTQPRLQVSQVCKGGLRLASTSTLCSRAACCLARHWWRKPRMHPAIPFPEVVPQLISPITFHFYYVERCNYFIG